jgi:ureidoacrylate peracid hydrolase
MPSPDLHLSARPEALTLRRGDSVIVIDMQNAYASPADMWIKPVSTFPAPRRPSRGLPARWRRRAAAMPIVYLQNGWDRDYVEAGTPGSPNWHKSNALKTMRRKTELQGELLTRGGWDYEIVDELAPGRDIRVHKPRYSAFFNSQLDSILRARGSAIWCLSGSRPMSASIDTARWLSSRIFRHPAGGCLASDRSRFHQAGLIYNIETFFGWVSTVRISKRLAGSDPAA